jgi:toxin ParE1/3/4
MAELVWTEPALSDLDQIADHIALDDPEAAKRLVKRIFQHVEQLQDQPESGSIPKELRPRKAYRQIVEKPCRVFYRIAGETIYIVHVMRGERVLRGRNLRREL